MRFYGVLSDQLDKVWDTVRPQIQRALDQDHNRVTISTVYKNIKTKSQQLWIADEGLFIVYVTTIIIFDNAKQLRILYCGGDSGNISNDQIKQIFDTFKSYAKSHGCTELEIWGRDGWLRVCPELKKDYTVMRLEL